MRIALDATPLLGPRTGVGTYTAHLLAELPGVLDPGDEIVASAFTLRGFRALAAEVPSGITVAARPAPARVLRSAWSHSDLLDVRLLTGRVDLVHGTNFVLPPSRAAAGVLTVHDLAYLRRPDTVAASSLGYVRLVARAVGRGAVVCTPSRAVADQVRDAYAISPDRVYPTPLGIDPSWAGAARATPEVARALGLPAAYLLAVGTLEPRKNLRLLLDAYRLAADRRVELPPLVLVGGQGWGERLLTEALPPGRVLTTGHVEQTQLRSVVAGAQALLFPSLDEGFGLPPLEALACGVPVLVSDLPVTREVLGDQAAYADPRDAEGFLDGMIQVLSDPIGTAESRRAHAAAFTWRACATATVQAYRAALAG